jgi:hypothetical protein
MMSISRSYRLHEDVAGALVVPRAPTQRDKDLITVERTVALMQQTDNTLRDDVRKTIEPILRGINDHADQLDEMAQSMERATAAIRHLKAVFDARRPWWWRFAAWWDSMLRARSAR